MMTIPLLLRQLWISQIPISCACEKKGRQEELERMERRVGVPSEEDGRFIMHMQTSMGARSENYGPDELSHFFLSWVLFWSRWSYKKRKL